MLSQTIKPLELIGKFRPWCRIAVRQVKTTDDHTVNHSLDIAAVCIIRVAWQTFATFLDFSVAREDRYALPAFLTMPYGLVTGIIYNLQGKLFVRSFKFLKTNHIRLRFCK